MKKFLVLLIVATIFSCKAKKTVAETVKSLPPEKITDEKIIENYYKVKNNFKTIFIKASVGYEDEKQSQNVSADIKIKKDEIILISVKFLGFTVAKALITPNEVKYYEKVGSKYFEGNYTTLSKWLGNDLDFSKVQNMLLGKVLDDLLKEEITFITQDNLYKLTSVKNEVQKTFLIEPESYLLKNQEFIQNNKNRKLQINYPNYKEFPESFIPTAIFIEAFANDKKTKVEIQYDTITFNEELTFPYEVPNGYKKILVN